MIDGFEDLTYELTDYEKNTLVPVLVKGLSQMTGKQNAFTNKQCCDKLSKLGYEVNDARFRKLIHHIRQNHLVPGLIGTSKGYYKAVDRKELETYIASLHERKNSIAEIIKALEVDLFDHFCQTDIFKEDSHE